MLYFFLLQAFYTHQIINQNIHKNISFLIITPIYELLLLDYIVQIMLNFLFTFTLNFSAIFVFSSRTNLIIASGIFNIFVLPNKFKIILLITSRFFPDDIRIY